MFFSRYHLVSFPCKRRRLLRFLSTSSSLPPLNLLRLRQSLDRKILGQNDVKDGLLLALVAKEHAYIEGPPGVGKTMVAELTSDRLGLSRFTYQMHRDTRLSDMLGDAVLVREPNLEGGGEIIRHSIRKGGLLTSQLCVLDDINRSPGEALNVLLRVLNERLWEGERIPLLTALATGNPGAGDEYFNDALDPAHMDRFTVQIQTEGLITGFSFEEAAQVVDQYSKPSKRLTDQKLEKTINGTCSDDGNDTYDDDLIVSLEDAHLAIERVRLPVQVRDGLLQVLRILMSEEKLHDDIWLLTDRTFLVKAPRILKAAAVLEGREECELEDLYVLRFLTTFRIPERVHLRMNDIIAAAIEEVKSNDINNYDDGENQKRLRPEEQKEANDEGGNDDNNKKEQEENENKDEKEEEKEEQIDENKQTDNPMVAMEGTQKVKAPQQESLSLMKWCRDLIAQATDPQEHLRQKNLHQDTILGIDALVAVLTGSFKRDSDQVTSTPNPGGQPRDWKQLDSFVDLPDTDPIDTLLWLNDGLSTPRTSVRFAKQRKGRGFVAVARDTSSSMWGLHTKWSSSVILKLFEQIRELKTPVSCGYLEFNDETKVHKEADGRVFSEKPAAIIEAAQSLSCDGLTNYQACFQKALEAFRQAALGGASNNHGSSSAHKHLVLFTDGSPTKGCVSLTKELSAAQKIGIRIHTIFIGKGKYPPLLHRLAEGTRGNKFQAVPKDDKGSTVELFRIAHDGGRLSVV